jgi:hypothetical protein
MKEWVLSSPYAPYDRPRLGNSLLLIKKGRRNNAKPIKKTGTG